MSENENALAVRTPSEYPLLRGAAAKELLAAFRDNLGAEGLNLQNLVRIKVPSGGALHWQVKTPEGTEMVKEVEGIIVAWRPARLYWKKSLNDGGGNQPPDCYSKDSFVGVGDPGGHCNLCPNAQFGSSQKGKGQACKQVRQMLLVPPGETLPHLVSIPPTSIKSSQQYFTVLLGRGLPYWAVTTKMRLEGAKNATGIEYAKVQFFMGRALSPQEREMLGPVHLHMEKMLDPITVDARDYTAEPNVNLHSPTSHGVFRAAAPVSAPVEDPDPPFRAGPDPAESAPADDDEVPF